MGRARLFAAVLALVPVALAACADGGIDATSTSALPSTQVRAPGGELPEGRGLVAEERDGTRTVTSTWGTVTVPLEPERVVSVRGDIDLETMLALDVVPVAAGSSNGLPGERFAPHVEPLTKGVEPLAWAGGVPVDRIAELRPDLIFAPDRATAELLSAIAPTVPRGSWLGDEWKQDFRYVAAVLGKNDEAAERLSSWEQEAREVYAAIADRMEGRTVASVGLNDEQTDVEVDPADAFSPAVLTEIGLEVAPPDIEGTGGSSPGPMSQLAELDADVLFWRVVEEGRPTPDSAVLAYVRNSPMWATLPASAAATVFEVDRRPWDLPSILGAERILQDVEAALA